MDKNSDEEILERFSGSAIRRMQSYQVYIGHIESGSLEAFLGDWHTTMDYASSCDTHCWVGPLGEDLCECLGKSHCYVTSDFLDDYIHDGCYCYPFTYDYHDCQRTYDEFLSSDTEAHKSLNGMLDEMKAALEAAINNFGEIFVYR